MRQGIPGFNGRRLREAREYYGLTITALADMIGVSKQAISKFENEDKGINPMPYVLDKIANTLNFPKKFFLQESFNQNENPIFYRSMSAATKTARLRAESKFTWMQEIVHILKNHIELPPANYPNTGIHDYTKLTNEDIEDLAKSTRRHWGLGDGPISNVITLLENNGVISSRLDLEAETLDALSCIDPYDNTLYMFLSSYKQSAARSRFDALHEFGHIVLHGDLNKNICNNPIEHSILEKQAHRFASAFLLPVKSFMDDLYPLSPTLEAFWALKEKWAVSIKAMIMRCSHLDIIDDEYAKKLYINYNRRGWAKREPLDDKIPIEQPKLLRRSFELLVNSGVLSREYIPTYLPYPCTVLEDLIGLPRGYFSFGDNVEVLPVLKRNNNVHGRVASNPNLIQFPKKQN